MKTYSSKSRFKELSLRVKRSPVPSEARQLLRLPRAAPSQRLRRIATPACRNLPHGVQARTFQVLAMTEWEKGFIL